MSRQYVQLWSWINEFGRQAATAHDQDRIQLWKTHTTAFKHREKDPEQAWLMYREAVALAERLNEPCMALYYEYWVAEMLLFYLGHYEEGLELATKLVAKSSQPVYANCPVQARVYITLIAAYSQIDMLSYTDEITTMIETMEDSIPLDDDTHRRLQAFRVELCTVKGEYDKGFAEALKYMELSGNDNFRTTHAYQVLCHLSYLLKNDQQALEYAYLIQENANRSNRHAALVNAHGWQATLLLLRGEAEESARLFLLSIAEANMLKLPPDQNFFRPRCRYYEAKGDYEQALALWDENVRMMNPQYPNRQGYFYTFLQRCFLLRYLNRLTDHDVELTRQAANRMHKPEKYLAVMESLHDGQTEIPRY
jgi:hypothetical protein